MKTTNRCRMARGRKRCSGGVYAFWKWHGTRVGLCKAHSAQAHRAGWKMWPRTKTKKRNPAGGAIRLLRMGTSGKWEAVKRHRSLAHHDLAVAEAARLAMLPEHKDRYVYVAVQGPGHHEIARFGGVGRDPGPDDTLRKMRMHGGYPNPADPKAAKSVSVRVIGSDAAMDDDVTLKVSVPEWGNLLAMIKAWKKYGHGRPSSIGVPEVDKGMPDAIGGWRWDVTGGGCSALMFDLVPGSQQFTFYKDAFQYPGKMYFMITDNAEVPSEMSTAVSLGVYNQEGGFIDYILMPQPGILKAPAGNPAGPAPHAERAEWEVTFTAINDWGEENTSRDRFFSPTEAQAREYAKMVVEHNTRGRGRVLKVERVGTRHSRGNPVSGYESDAAAQREAFWEGDEEPA